MTDRPTLAVIDASNVAVTSLNGRLYAEWGRIDAVLTAWRALAGRTRVLLVADRSLTFRLDAAGERNLLQWIRTGRGQIVRWADPVVCELAQAEDARIISNDDYRDLRSEFGFLQGCERVLGFHFAGDDAVLLPRRLEPISAFEISRAHEHAQEVPRRLREPGGRQLLDFEWSCATDGCPGAEQDLLDALPVNRGGAAHCPDCDQPLSRCGRAGLTIEAKVIVADHVALRLPVGEGDAVAIGRGPGELVDIAKLAPADDAARVSRRHVELHNRSGRLYALDPGSSNGTQLNGVRLETGILTRVNPGETLQIARTVGVQISGKRYPRGRFSGVIGSGPEADRTARS